VIVIITPSEQFSAMSWREQVTIRWDDVCFVLYKHA